MTELSLHLDPGTEEDLLREARMQELSETEMAERAIKSYLRIQSYKRAEIAAAIAEADKGVFISGEAIHRWIESWDTEDELPPPEPDVFLPARGA